MAQSGKPGKRIPKTASGRVNRLVTKTENTANYREWQKTGKINPNTIPTHMKPSKPTTRTVKPTISSHSDYKPRKGPR